MSLGTQVTRLVTKPIQIHIQIQIEIKIQIQIKFPLMSLGTQVTRLVINTLVLRIFLCCENRCKFPYIRTSTLNLRSNSSTALQVPNPKTCGLPIVRLNYSRCIVLQWYALFHNLQFYFKMMLKLPKMFSMDLIWGNISAALQVPNHKTCGLPTEL